MSNENNVAVATEEKVEIVDGMKVEKPAETKPAETPEIEKDDSLTKLNTEDLISIIHETRSEAKNRRLKQRELEEKVEEIEKQKKLDEQAQLEKNSEWEKLYNKQKEDTADYEEIKKFKMDYLEDCKTQIEEISKGLTKAELEVFELSANNMSYDKQLILVNKMIANRSVNSIVENTQSTTRINDVNLTKEDLLKDMTLMKKVKEKNPILYEKFFGK